MRQDKGNEYDYPRDGFGDSINVLGTILSFLPPSVRLSHSEIALLFQFCCILRFSPSISSAILNFLFGSSPPPPQPKLVRESGTLHDAENGGSGRKERGKSMRKILKRRLHARECARSRIRARILPRMRALSSKY